MKEFDNWGDDFLTWADDTSKKLKTKTIEYIDSLPAPEDYKEKAKQLSDRAMSVFGELIEKFKKGHYDRE